MGQHSKLDSGERSLELSATAQSNKLQSDSLRSDSLQSNKLQSNKLQSNSLRQSVLSWLETQVPPSRIEHVLRVEAMAIELAVQHHHAPDHAAQAGLMHDLAKYFKPQRLLDMALAHGLQIDPVDEANPHLLHADVGAIVAQEEFGITHNGVLRAIANHTLGSPHMDALSCIVYLADSLEPGRGDTSELHQMRQVAHQDLSEAVWLTADYSLKKLLEKHRLIHPRALQTRNWFMQEVRQRRAALHHHHPEPDSSSDVSLSQRHSA
jgi:predicted HD superfamily hydrolase involved in NAD metabolism